MSKRRRRKDRNWLGAIGDVFEFIFELGWEIIKLPFKIIAHIFD